MAKSTAAIRVFGDDLNPDEITKLLGCEPTKSHRRGDLISPNRGNQRRNGMWCLTVPDAEPENYEEQVNQLLAGLTPDLSVWHQLGQRFEVDLFCGFFMDNRNQGFVLSIRTLAALTERGITPEFDVYAPTPEEEAEYWAKQDTDALAKSRDD
ncbi:DUF4279 domain-containing protein [Roseateles sp.]|uniref:DUF4279 domain-containing protein n=1 Tax=Roseateles sp. TaxID=1971397 RepID=UPI0032638BB3